MQQDPPPPLFVYHRFGVSRIKTVFQCKVCSSQTSLDFLKVKFGLSESRKYTLQPTGTGLAGGYPELCYGSYEA
jgi:hypothetical protein